MQVWSRASVCGVLAISLSAIAVAQRGEQTAMRDAELPVPTPTLVETASAELPDSPSAVQAGTQNASQAQSTPSQATSSSSQSAPSASPQDAKPQRPVGTAAAEAPVVSGVTAAQPSGVAIAPAKQHRARTIVIRVGAIMGAAAAIGAVVALTAGTGSKPPGAQ